MELGTAGAQNGLRVFLDPFGAGGGITEVMGEQVEHVLRPWSNAAVYLMSFNVFSEHMR
jgi:hypothetical protein